MGGHSLGEDLTADEARDATFLLTEGRYMGWKTGLPHHGPYNQSQEGPRAITQGVTDHQVKVRGAGCPQVNLPAQQPFRFNHSRGFPIRDASGDGGSDCQPSPH